MNYRLTKTPEQMAQVFYETGLWFDSLPEDKKVNMLRGMSDADVGDCGSPACFGGWLAVKYNTETDDDGYRFYENGAEAFCRDLGIMPICGKDYSDIFETDASDVFADWASHNFEIWGNMYGHRSFIEPSAFGCYYEQITIKHIARHLIGVAKRLDENVESSFFNKKKTIKPVMHNTQKV